MTRSQIGRWIDAHDALWEGWWPALVRVPRGQAHRDVGGSYPTLFLTARHMVNAEIYWQDRLQGVRGAGDLATRSMTGIERAWVELRDRRRRWLANADPSRRVRFEAPNGPASATAWQCVLHVVTHAHFHRGQLAMQYRALGMRPPSRHLMGHFIGLF
jgi:uncharacterized damage-inducible protein DinB